MWPWSRGPWLIAGADVPSVRERSAAMIAPCICARGVAANELEDVPLVGQACYFAMLTLPVFFCCLLLIQETAVQCHAWSDMAVVLMECKGSIE